MGGLGLKKAAAVLSIAFYLNYANDMRRLAIFGVVAAIVPPPAGILTGLLAVGFYETAKRTGRLHRKIMGHAQPEDFEILRQFNEQQCRACRRIIPLPHFEKTVFCGPEMR